MGTRSDKYPWMLLGIAETSDKDAIHAAYKAKRATLDAQAMRISAFAELTEAREKALFIASELLRERDRTGAAPVAKSEATPTSDPLAPTSEPEPEPEPQVTPELSPDTEAEEESEPETEPDREPGGRFSTATESAADFIDDTAGPAFDYPPSLPRAGTTPHWEVAKNDAEIASEEVEWSHGGGYVPEGDRDFQAILGEEYHPREQSEAWSNSARPGSVFERYNLNKTATLWLLGVFLFLAFCSSISSDDEYPVADEITATPPGAQIVPPDPQRLEAMVDELFGEDMSAGNLAALGGPLTVELVRHHNSDIEGFPRSRATLRRAIIEAAPLASREQALSIAELRLAWLITAQEQGRQACNAVTTRTFEDGVPVMEEDWVAFERSLAASLLQSRSFAQGTREIRVEALQDWVFTAAAERYAVDELTMRNAMADPAGTNRCSVEIVLLQAMLDRPDEVTPGMLAAF